MNNVNKRASAHGKPLENRYGMASFWNNRYDFVLVKVGNLGMEIASSVFLSQNATFHVLLPLARRRCHALGVTEGVMLQSG